MKSKSRERITALVLLVVLAFYSLTIGWRGVLLVGDGRLVPVVLGIAVILLPLIAVAAIWRLVIFARDGQSMMAQMNAGDSASDAAKQVAFDPHDDRDEQWRALLVEAETHRVAKDRPAEQRSYRAAVRAWRSSRLSQ